MTIPNLKEIMERNNLKNESMNESDKKRIYSYLIYPRNSKQTPTKDL